MTVLLLVLVTFLVAYANGANDNVKGVATLLGSRTTGYRAAIAWATATTFAGALTAAVLAAGLVRRFSGKGLVPDALTQDPGFLVSVGLSAAATVLLAAFLGLPISTTHALMGALVGAGFVAAPGALNLAVLGSGFVLPLVVSPLLAGVLAGALYPFLRLSRVRLGIERDSCLCAAVGAPLLQPAGFAPGVLAAPRLEVSTGTVHGCGERYGGGAVALHVQALLDVAHWLSAGTLSFARGLNDAPKIVALIVAFHALGLRSGLLLVAAAMAAGGLLGARRVAETMSNRVTGMNRGQGFTANLVASVLVLVASRFALPVSTTHVSCGALFGIGAATGRARWSTIRQILAAWVTTLPLAALLGAVAAAILA